MRVSPYRRRTSDEVLQAIERLQKAHLKIFIGAAAGVGKTYAMLQEAHALMAGGVDVVAGVIEAHGREETAALLEGIEAIPRLEVPYRGLVLKELNLPLILERLPDVVLVDELAHTNAPGLKNEKRYQDVLDILEAGINVHATLNIQHLESLNDVIAQITGIHVRETVPDSILQGAAEIRLIDLAPEALIQRLHEGKVYPPDQARRALENFFRQGNLTALRELVLRTVADTTDEDLDAYKRAKNIPDLWNTKERVLVCITPNPSGQILIRRGYRIAQRLKGDFFVATVTRPGRTPSHSEAKGLDLNIRLAEELGAMVIRAEDLQVAKRLVEIATDVKATQIVLGESRRGWWDEFRHGSVIDRVLKETHQADILIVAQSTP